MRLSSQEREEKGFSMNRMTTEKNYEALTQARAAYNDYWESHVQQLFAKGVADRLTEAEIASRIPDSDVQLEFIRRSIDMLQANVEHAAFLAIPMKFAMPLGASEVGFAIVLAAIAFCGAGYEAAIAAAACYLLGAGSARSAAEIHFNEMESHNQGVRDHRESIEKCTRSLDELRGLSASI